MYNDDRIMHYGIPGMKWGILNTRESFADRRMKKQARKDAFRYSSLESNKKIASPRAMRKLSQEIYEKAKTNASYAKEFGAALASERGQVARVKSYPKKIKRTKKMLVKNIEGTKRMINGKNALNQMDRIMGKSARYIKDNSLTVQGWKAISRNEV